MSETEYQKLLNARLQRELTAAEQARLEELTSQHPEIRDHWDEEMRLSGLLDRLPDAPLSSIFTARVLEAAQSEELPGRAARRPRLFGWLPMRWVHAATAGCVALALAWIVQDQRRVALRAELADDLAQISAVALAPDAELDALMHFEEIDRLGEQPVVDDELLAALEQK